MNTSRSVGNQKRLDHLDGLRGCAILAVLLFHSYSRWGEIEPFVQNYLIVQTFSLGWLGVQLFFCISGYVIYMSLQKSDNFVEFLVRRYTRLAPAMLMGSLLIYVSAQFIPERPGGAVDLIDFLPSLTFIDPQLLSKILGVSVKPLDGVFWSLFVEVKFYIFVAVAFFLLKDRQLNSLFLVYLIWLIFNLLISLGLSNVAVINLTFKILTSLVLKIILGF